MKSALAYLASLEKIGINLGLERITNLLQSLDNPHLRFKSFHIAGTNGKGSTAAMLASILKTAGYRVGLYTSPHLLDYRERIRINGEDISRPAFAQGLKLIQEIARKRKLSPTVFEVLTALAFWYFAKQRVDYAVVEVGLGGRLDATNVLTPLVSVITNIDYEHTEVLGKTLTRIAREKAAIIKPGVPVVTAEGKGEALKVIQLVSKKKRSTLIEISSKQEHGTQNVERRTQEQNYGSSKLALKGEHQKINTACALAALMAAKIKVTKRAIRQGLLKTHWPGRFQIISRRPLVIVDGAHNPSGAKALRVTIKELYPKTRFTVIWGMQSTKDHWQVLQALRPIIGTLIITRSSNPQAAEPGELVKDLPLKGINYLTASSLKAALLKWDHKSPLLITGSLFLVADALRLF